jgi:tetratricopeptide (TPR) repeat protein
MSYINDALRKAQQEKDNRYGRYGAIISRLPERTKRAGIRWLAVAVLLALAFAIFWSVAFNRFEQAAGVKPRAAERTDQAQTPTAPSGQTTQAITIAAAPSGSPTAATPPTNPPSEAVLLYREALNAQRNHQAPAAELLYRRVLELDEQHVQAMNNLAVLYMAQDKQDEAIGLFDRAIVLRKDYVDPYYNLACLWAQRGDAVRSIRYLESAVAIDRKVIDWARNDKDLGNIRERRDFKALMGNSK